MYSTKCAPRAEGKNITNQTAAKQFRRHRRCTTETATDAAAAVAAAATDTQKVGGALVWEDA